MSDFKDTMMAQLEEYRQATAPAEPGTRRKTASTVTYECEVSGIDMIVSRMVNGRCTMKLFVYLSQTDSDGRGIMFIKTMKDGTMKEATDDAIGTFLRETVFPVSTGSNVVPFLRKGKEFAVALYTLRDPEFVALAKEGLINTDLIESENMPWFAKENSCRVNHRGVGIKDRHAKLIRHAAEALVERDGIDYSTAITRMCKPNNWDDPTYYFVWAFSSMADMFDEPFAMRCFDEHIDNHRMGGLSADTLRRFLARITGEVCSYSDSVEAFRNGKGIVNLDKNRFWEFLQHAVAVGMGRKLDDYISLYGDYLYLAHSCDGKVKDKYPEFPQVTHDVYNEKYNIVREFQNSEAVARKAEIGRRFVDQIHGGYELRTLGSVNEFLEEAQQNCNCVASYVEAVKNGKCLIASFRPRGSDTTLLTIEIDPEGYMVQIRGRYNRMPTEKEEELLRPFKAGIGSRMDEAGVQQLPLRDE